MDNNALLLKIRTREGIVYQGSVTGVSSTNEVGKFDVITNHANFITIIKKALTIHEALGDKEITLDNGIMKVEENSIEVLLGVKS